MPLTIVFTMIAINNVLYVKLTTLLRKVNAIQLLRQYKDANII